jgi:hypothetical protein
MDASPWWKKESAVVFRHAQNRKYRWAIGNSFAGSLPTLAPSTHTWYVSGPTPISGDALAVAGHFQQGRGDQDDRLGQIEPQAARPACGGEVAGDVNEEVVAFLRRQVHDIVLEADSSRGRGGPG